MKRSPQKFRIGLFFAVFTGAVVLLVVCPAMLTAGRAGSFMNAQEKGGRTKTTPTPAPAETPRPIPRATPRSVPRATPRPTSPRQIAPQIEMVLIPSGTFTMGSPDSEQERKDDEGPQHQVTVRSFYMGKYEVTQAQYRAVMGTSPSNFKGDDRPVENVSWNDAVEFCRRLSRMTGREYRLPTESEWEYACRAGTSGPYAGDLDSMAWYSNNSGNQTHSVGQKQPNAFGLYDMHGNVWEWCQDWFHRSYNGAPTDGSAWESGGGQYRVLRGGSWNVDADVLRSAYRSGATPDSRYNVWNSNSYGFRVVASARA